MADFDKNYDNPDLGEDLGTVTLTLDDGTEIECDIVAIYPANGRQYIALLPSDDGEDEEEGDVLIYRYIDNGEDLDPEIENIEDDDEYDIAADAFDELLDDVDFEDLD